MSNNLSKQKFALNETVLRPDPYGEIAMMPGLEKRTIKTKI